MQESDVGLVWQGENWQEGDMLSGPGVTQGLSPSGGDGRGDWEGSSTCV